MTTKGDCLEDNPNLLFELELGRKIRAGEPVSDFEFDQIYSGRIRILSSVHWTPIKIAIHAATLATEDGQTRVLDVGSGAGKFCTIGALTTAATFVGLEQREYLVDVANEVARRLEVSNVSYIHSNSLDFNWAEFESIYIYNPFSENLDQSIRIDDLCELSVDLYVKYVRHAQWQLAQVRSGTRVIIYNRFGGELPPTFECLQKEEIDFLSLEVWRKK